MNSPHCHRGKKKGGKKGRKKSWNNVVFHEANRESRLHGKTDPLVRFPVNRSVPLFFYPLPLLPLCVCLSWPFSLLVLFFFSFFFCVIFSGFATSFYIARDTVVLCGYVIAWLWSLSPLFECRWTGRKIWYSKFRADIGRCVRIAFEIWKFRFTIFVELPFLRFSAVD